MFSCVLLRVMGASARQQLLERDNTQHQVLPSFEVTAPSLSFSLHFIRHASQGRRAGSLPLTETQPFLEPTPLWESDKGLDPSQYFVRGQRVTREETVGVLAARCQVLSLLERVPAGDRRTHSTEQGSTFAEADAVVV